RFPIAAATHARDREHQEEGHLRENVPRRAAAGERRGHEQWRRLRWIASDLRRRARRPAVQSLRGVNRPVPDPVAQLRQPLPPILRSGTLVPFGVAFIQETTIFREFGPLAGNTMRLAYDVAPKIGSTLSRQTFDGDVRHYTRIGTTGLLATRVRGFKSIGAYP